MLTVPPGSADHTFSHRVVTYGRVVDADGTPLVGYRVELAGPLPGFSGYCDQRDNSATAAWNMTQHAPDTNERGEFIHCLHIHSMRASDTVQYQVRLLDPAGNTSGEGTVQVDPIFRTQYQTFVADDPVPDARSPVARNETTVLARVLEMTGSSNIEHVQVHGKPRGGAAVLVTVSDANGTQLQAWGTTNDYGDVAIRVPTPDGFVATQASVEVEGVTASAPVGAGYAGLKVSLPHEGDPVVRQFLMYSALGVGAVALGLGVVWLARRGQEPS